jgi:hypothetical protein
VQLRHVILTERYLSGTQQRSRFLAGERQVTRADLQNFALGSQPRDAQRRLGPPGLLLQQPAVTAPSRSGPNRLEHEITRRAQLTGFLTGGVRSARRTQLTLGPVVVFGL